MRYLFSCKSCGAEEEKEIAIADYDKEKENQKCTCGGKRIVSLSGKELQPVKVKVGLVNQTEVMQYSVDKILY